MIKYYFRLQFIIIQRNLIEWGVRPVLAYPLIIIGFILSSLYLFSKLEWAAELYSLISLFLISGLSNTNRINFFKACIAQGEYIVIRTIENLICLLPFAIFLLLKSQWFYSILILICGVLLSRMNIDLGIGKTIPTPFSKSPFEFPVGFRKTFPLIVLAYTLTTIGLMVGNFNLAVFSLGFNFLIILSYYSFLEKPEYIWIYSRKPGSFLIQKIKSAVLNAAVLCIPILLMLFIFELDRLFPIFLIFTIGELFLITLILNKYTAYPREMNVPNGILMGFSLLFPPLLLVLIPYFYNQSLASLKKILV